jgi:hypothetical protein
MRFSGGAGRRTGLDTLRQDEDVVVAYSGHEQDAVSVGFKRVAEVFDADDVWFHKYSMMLRL